MSRADNGGVTKVLDCWRYPVKSAAAEAVTQLALTTDGVVGDRLWAVLADDGTVVSAKHPSRGGRLLHVSASYDDETGAVTVSLPGGPAYSAGDPQLNTALSEWLGRPVAITDVVPSELALHRLWPREAGMLPEWADAQPGDQVLTQVAGAARGRFVDYGQLHLVTTGALARLETELGRPVQPLRFRPNLLIDLPDDPSPGDVVHIGDAELLIDLPTPRCVMPSLTQAGVAASEPDVLKILARHHRQPVADRGNAAVFGRYAIVRRAGRISKGDVASLGSGQVQVGQ